MREEIVRTALSTGNFLSFLEKRVSCRVSSELRIYKYLENIRNNLRTVEIRSVTNALITKEISEHLFYIDDNSAKRNEKIKRRDEKPDNVSVDSEISRLSLTFLYF